MFQQTFVDSAQPSGKPYSVAMSLLLQLSILGVFALLPLIYTQVLPSAQLRDLLVAPAPPPVPSSIAKTQAKSTSRPAIHRLLNVMIAPPSIPHVIAKTDAAAPDIDAPAVVGSLGNENGVPSGVLNTLGSDRTPEPPPPPAAPPKPQKAAPLRVGGNVAESKLIHKILPVYPPLAKSARIEGLVEFSAIISKDGNIENLKLLHGHPLLVKAAQDAVSQWKYQPTLLNGQPVEVITDIVVTFRLSQ